MTLEEKLRSVLETYGDGFVQKLRDKLEQIVKPPATGEGARSLRSEVDGSALNITGLAYLSALDTGTSGYKGIPYPRDKEGGIDEWIRRKGIRSTKGYTIKQLSFVIAKAIYDRGTRPTDFLDIVFREDRGRLENMLLDGITEHIDTIITKPFAEQTQRNR